ncbi:MAG: TRAP transporter substrate-binding protein DctP [Pseudolabrys sp.]
MTTIHSVLTSVAASAGARARCSTRTGIIALALLSPLAAQAGPIELKLSFFASAQSGTYRYGVKPFVDAVNAEGKGLISIKVYPNGALGKAVAEQPGMVLDGAADIAWVVPGQTPYRFPDNQVIELPGVFRDGREGTLVYTRLIASNALRGYQDFFVIGAYTGGVQVIHGRKPLGSLAALKGQKIRANNQMEAEALSRLGAIPTVMPASRLADGLAQGAIDAIVMSSGGLFQFGTARLVPNHYLLGMGTAPLVVVMNRKKFDSLPAAAQALIRKYSGERAAAIWIESFVAVEQRSLEKIKSDAAQKVVEPSPADRVAAQQVYKSLIDAWAAKSARNRELLKTIEADLATIRLTAQ